MSIKNIINDKYSIEIMLASFIPVRAKLKESDEKIQKEYIGLGDKIADDILLYFGKEIKAYDKSNSIRKKYIT